MIVKFDTMIAIESMVENKGTERRTGTGMLFMNKSHFDPTGTLKLTDVKFV